MMRRSCKRVTFVDNRIFGFLHKFSRLRIILPQEQKSSIFAFDDDADDDACSQYQSLKSFVVFLFSVSCFVV